MQRIIITLLLLIATITNAQVNLLNGANTYKQEQWVDSIMKKMTLDEKIGQIFMIAAYSGRGASHKMETTRMIQKYKVGNLIFMKGTPEKQVVLNNFFQSKAKVPLLIGFDGEWGLDMRLKNTYRFPWNMTLGAIQNNQLIEEFGVRLGEHCKRVGIHMNFAPVLDINTNPKNPIIGNRSFGEDKENVTLKAIAFTRGMQGVGVLANGKHFPGHGDSSQDSHKTLPSINFSKERIFDIELYPYKRLFDEGLASVMVAHLRIPSLEKEENLPSSLSKTVVTDILKGQLGFKGLIFTDGMGMAGAADYGKPSEVNLKAFLAGNDVLLIPSDVPGTIRLFKKSLKEGKLSEERLNHSVRKVLKAKYSVGLQNYQPIIKKNVVADLNTPEDEVLHRKLVKNSLTLIQNKGNLFPIKNLKTSKIAYVKLGDSDNKSFLSMLKNYTQVDEVKATNLQALKKYNLVIVGFHKSNKNPWKSYKFSDADLKRLQQITKDNKVILNVFSSPYALLQLESFENIESVLVSYQNSKIAQELSAQAIFGGFGVNGSLPVSIKSNFPLGQGLITNSLNRLQYTIPEEVGMSSDSLNKINLLVRRVIKERMAPGAQVLVARHGKVIYNNAFGYQTTARRRAVKTSDIYDLASLTKILGTLPMVMKADEENVLSINSSFGELMPSLKGSNKDTIQLKEALSHYGRLTPWIPFYKRTQSGKGQNLRQYYSAVKTNKYPIEVAKGLYLNKAWKDSIATIIKDVDQKPTLRYRYSDIGYYILKDILEDKYGKRLDKLVSENFYKSMGMNRMMYLPLEKINKNEIVPSEKDNYFRHQVLRGHVHDMGAAMQGGVGGHAGLFSNANDVAKLMQLYLDGGSYGGIQYLQAETIDKFNKRYFATKNKRGLGFDKPRQKNTCSCVSERSFGHSGFTGTYTWADPESGIVYVFLSNRTYPTMNNKKLAKTGIRTIIQGAVQKSIIQ